MVGRRIRVPEEAKINFHSFEDVLKMIMIFIDEFSGCDLEFFCIHHNGGAVSVRTAYERSALPLFPEGSDKYVSRYVCTQVPDVAFTIGIWESAGYEYGFIGWKIGHGILTWKFRYKIHFSNFMKFRTT
jgi:hypothetical protein